LIILFLKRFLDNNYQTYNKNNKPSSYNSAYPNTNSNNQGFQYSRSRSNNDGNAYSNNQNYNGNVQPSNNNNNQRPMGPWFDVEANANVNWNAWNNQYAYKSTSSIASCSQVKPAANLNLTRVYGFH
jgi:hypothetical protein